MKKYELYRAQKSNNDRAFSNYLKAEIAQAGPYFIFIFFQSTITANTGKT